MNIHSDKFSDNEPGNDVTKQRNSNTEMKKGEIDKEGLMNIHSDKFSNNEPGNDVTKQRNSNTEMTKGEIEEVTVGKKDMEIEKPRMVREEVTRSQLENRNRETSLGREKKTIRGEEEKIDFFPQWKHSQGVVEEEEEEEEQYMTIDEDGRPYIAVRRKRRNEQEKEGQCRG